MPVMFTICYFSYECHIRLENTHFENINGAWADYGGVANGEICWENQIFVKF